MKQMDVVMLKGESLTGPGEGGWNGREEGWECTVVQDKGDKVLVKCKHNNRWYTELKVLVVANLTQGLITRVSKVEEEVSLMFL